MSTTFISRKRSSWEIQRAVVFAMFVRELKTRFGGRLIGIFWLLFEPLAHMALMVWIRTSLRDRMPLGVAIDLPVWLVVGLLPFLMFRRIWTRVMDSAASNVGLFGYRQVKPFDAVLARTLLEVTLSVVILVVALLILGWMGYHFFPYDLIEFIGVVTILIFFGLGLGLISLAFASMTSATSVFVGLLSFPLYILSGVIIPLRSFDPAIVEILMWNPVVHLLEMCRDSFFPSYPMLNGVNPYYPMAWAIGSMGVGMVMYRWRRERMLSIRR